MIEKVDLYIAKHEKFSHQLNELRNIMLSQKLKETLKWGMPTYTYQNKNIAGIGAFKLHFGIWFFKGALLKDTKHVLINAQQGKTHAMRQWRFDEGTKINKKLVSSYIHEAIENEKRGLKVKSIKKHLIIPPELKYLLNKDKEFESSFNGLTLAKKREYSEYIMEAKKDSTKEKRLEKIIPMIIGQVGLNDAYKKG